MDRPHRARFAVEKVLAGTLLALVGMMSGCAELGKVAEIANIQKPTAKIIGTKLNGLNFDQADLIFDFAVQNDNPIGLNLAGLHYQLMVDGNPLVGGTQNQGLRLPANGSSTVSVPVSLKFDDLKRVIDRLSKQDEVPYTLETAFRFNLPIIGPYSIPVKTSGIVPVPKMPSFSVENLQVNNVGFTSADVALKIGVDNPNAFGLALGKLAYELQINGAQWGEGSIAQGGSVPAKGKGVITIPMRLNILQLGRSAYTILVEEKPVDYKFSGGMALDTTLDLLKNLNIPIDLAGRVPVK